MQLNGRPFHLLRSLKQIQGLDPENLISWTLDNFEKKHIVLSTGFGMEGCVLIDMAAQKKTDLTVYYLDTGFFFPETYELIDELKNKYKNITLVNAGTSLSPADQESRYGPRLWEKDPDACCRLRKVLPMQRLLKDVEVWITGVRSDQSVQRQSVQKMEWHAFHQVWKVSPLASWTRRQVWEYIRNNEVPHNILHHKGYPSIGCVQCTKEVDGISVQEYSRKGRWSGSEKTECGLHQ